MKVNVINEYRVEMELGEDELSDFDVTYETLDYGNINTRRFLHELADSARSFGVEADMSGKVLIEAFRTGGGCRLCFTFLPPRGKDAPSVKQLIKRDAALVYEFRGSVAELCGFCAALRVSPEGSLYRVGRDCALFVFASPGELEVCADAAAELGIAFSDCSEIRLAHFRESCECILERGAVKTLAGV